MLAGTADEDIGHVEGILGSNGESSRKRLGRSIFGCGEAMI